MVSMSCCKVGASPVDLDGELRFCSVSFGCPEMCSVGTEGALPVDHTPIIKSVRAYENK